MKIIRSVSSFRAWRDRFPFDASIGLVPTMGALHDGHMSLMERSLRENKTTVVTIFVNPIQFGPREDLKKYPRPWRNDLAKLRGRGVPVLFAPEPRAMYSDNFSTKIRVGGLSDRLCGSPASRGPSHFEGVATVVAKLLALVRPSRAYFGEKDFQQLRVIERLNDDLNFGTRIVRCPIVRENDGLAMSSRNRYLSAAERSSAAMFPLALQQGRKLLTSQRKMSSEAIIRHVKSILSAVPALRIDYIELVDPETLRPAPARRRPLLLAGAVWIGRTRLIDNILVS